jgi:hypothetical protein
MANIKFKAGFPAYPEFKIPFSIFALDDLYGFYFAGRWSERRQFSLKDGGAMQRQPPTSPRGFQNG